MVQTVEGVLMDSGIFSGPSPPRKSAAVLVSAGISMNAWPKDTLDVEVEVRNFV